MTAGIQHEMPFPGRASGQIFAQIFLLGMANKNRLLSFNFCQSLGGHIRAAPPDIPYLPPGGLSCPCKRADPFHV
jgi:hypothetical protein